MGVTLQWRGDPGDRDDRHHETSTTFGGGRSRGEGHLFHSDRVGPCLLVIGSGDPVRELARGLGRHGFTVLAVESQDAAVLEEAARFLTDNWHPRLGVIAVGGADVTALLQRVTPDAIVCLGDGIETEVPLLVVEDDRGGDSGDEVVDFLLYNVS